MDDKSDTAPLGVGRSDYHDRRDARADRLDAGADRANAASAAASQTAHTIAHAIPMGQPILVGHHSERRHRRDVDKMQRSMSRAVAEDRKAKTLARRADAARNNRAISSDDPEAVERLTAKVAAMEAERDRYKAYNRAARKAGNDTLPAYVLKNLGANIRRVRQRIETVETQATQSARSVEIGDWTAVENGDVNRLQLRADDDRRATPDERRDLKSHGFRWAPSETAWQRKISNGAWYAATLLMGRWAAR